MDLYIVLTFFFFYPALSIVSHNHVSTQTKHPICQREVSSTCMHLCFCAVLVREVDYCLCNVTAHVQSFPTHTLSNVNTVNAFNRHEVVAPAHWHTDLYRAAQREEKQTELIRSGQ